MTESMKIRIGETPDLASGETWRSEISEGGGGGVLNI